MAAGVFGAIGYDMIRLVERLPDVNPDPLDLPDAMLTRPSIVAVFDGIAQEIILSTTVRPSSRSAGGRLRGGLRGGWRWSPRRLPSPLPAPRSEPQSRAPGAFSSPVSPRGLLAPSSSEPNATSRPATSSRWCPATVSARRSPLDPFALYRSLRRTNPSPFLFFLNFRDFQLVGSSPEILVRLRDGKITIRPTRRHAAPRRDAGGGRLRSRRSCSPTRRSTPST